MAGSSGPAWPLKNAFEDFLVAPVTSWAHAFSPVFNLSRTVDEAVSEYRGSHPKGVGKSDVDAVLEGLAWLRHTDPQAHDGLVQQLRRYVDAAS